MLPTKNRKEKFAKLFLQEIQKNPLPKFLSPIFPILKEKKFELSPLQRSKKF